MDRSWFLPPAVKDPYVHQSNQESNQLSDTAANLPETYKPSPVDKATSLLSVAKLNK